MGGASLTLRTVDCHDNGGSCIGGGGSANVNVDDLNCWNNGSAYSMTPAFRFAACIKRAAVYSGPGNTTVTNSFIHDNPWVGVWCDFCKYGFFHIQGNRFVHNGRAGVQWEMSGGWTPSDHALVKENVFQGNNYLEEEIGADVVISSANDIVVTSNVFTEERRTSIDIVFTTSRNPPQPRGVGVVIEDNMVDSSSDHRLWTGLLRRTVRVDPSLGPRPRLPRRRYHHGVDLRPSLPLVSSSPRLRFRRRDPHHVPRRLDARPPAGIRDPLHQQRLSVGSQSSRRSRSHRRRRAPLRSASVAQV